MTTPTDLTPLLDALADEAGTFADGYTSEDVDATLGRLSTLSGLRLVAVWQYVDWCTGGDSNLAVVDADGTLTDLSSELWFHLSGEVDPDVLLDLVRVDGADALVGTAAWVTDIAGTNKIGDLVEVTRHNYAGERRT